MTNATPPDDSSDAESTRTASRQLQDGKADHQVPSGQSQGPTTTTRRTRDPSTDDNNGLLSRVKSLAPWKRNSTSETHLSDRLKQLIGPSGIEYESDYVKLGNTYCRTYVVTSWPRNAQVHLLSNLFQNPDLIYNAGIHYEPYDQSEAIDTLADLEESLEDRADGELSEYLPNIQAVKETLSVVGDMKVRVQTNGQTLYDVSIYITVYSKSKEDLVSLERQIQEAVEAKGDMGLAYVKDFQDRGLHSSSPLGWNQMDDVKKRASQLVLDEAAATTFPFIDDTIVEPSGVLKGFNLADRTAVVLDIFKRNNGYCKLVLGDLGSGKSASVGFDILRHRVNNPDDNIVMIDPVEGFYGVSKAIGGEIITIGGSNTINPLQIEPTPEDVLENTEIDPWRMKLEENRWFFSTLFETYGMEDIDTNVWAVLNDAMKRAYKSNGIYPDPSTHHNESPIPQDIIDSTIDMIENPEEYTDTTVEEELERWRDSAITLKNALSPLRDGNELDNLNGKTAFEIDDTVPTYIDLSAYDGEDAKDALMLRIVFSMVYEQIKQTDRRTVLALDEAHKLIDDDDEADYWEEVIRHSRHNDTSIQLISQELEDFFQKEQGGGANEAAKRMANLCTVKQIHRINNADRELAKEGLGLTDEHINFIRNEAVPGESEAGYTTSLLHVADRGYLGLKVVPTNNELALVDRRPDNEFGDGDVPVPDDQRISAAFEVEEALTQSNNGEVSRQTLGRLINQIPLTAMSKAVQDQFIDRLVENHDDLTEAERPRVEQLVKSSEGFPFAPNDTIEAHAIDEDGQEVTLKKQAGELDESTPGTESISTEGAAGGAEYSTRQDATGLSGNAHSNDSQQRADDTTVEQPSTKSESSSPATSSPPSAASSESITPTTTASDPQVYSSDEPTSTRGTEGAASGDAHAAPNSGSGSQLNGASTATTASTDSPPSPATAVRKAVRRIVKELEGGPVEQHPRPPATDSKSAQQAIFKLEDPSNGRSEATAGLTIAPQRLTIPVQHPTEPISTAERRGAHIEALRPLTRKQLVEIRANVDGLAPADGKPITKLRFGLAEQFAIYEERAYGADGPIDPCSRIRTYTAGTPDKR